MKAEIIAILPEIILAVGTMMLMLCGVGCQNKKGNEAALSIVNKSSMIVIITALAALLYSRESDGVFFFDLYTMDLFAVTVKAILLFAGGTVLLLSNSYLEENSEKVGFEYPLLIMLSLCGMMLMVSSNDMLSMYMGIELQSLALYVLAAIRRDDGRSAEAGMKYFVLGALASGILLYGGNGKPIIEISISANSIATTGFVFAKPFKCSSLVIPLSPFLLRTVIDRIIAKIVIEVII